MKLKVRKGYKCNSEPGDAHPDGSEVTVIGRVPKEKEVQGKSMYFCLYKGSDIPVATLGSKLKLEEEIIHEEVPGVAIYYMNNLPKELSQFF